MSEFNLIDESWIPCIDLEGRRIDLGIRETLLKAHELREICDDSPLVTVAIHRLLLAILYRAYKGPEDFQSWKKMFANRAFNQESITSYLIDFFDRFHLISENSPFYQMEKLLMKKSVPITRLATECASGNNATLFDHCFDEEDVHWSPAQAVKWLVACQSFALGFGKSGTATINSKDENLPYSSDAIALRGMSIWLQGKSLFETLMINLPPTSDSSMPPWEHERSNPYRDRLHGHERKTVASFGTVDLFTWQSRLLRLLSTNGSVKRMYFAQGRSADKSSSDPMKVYRISKEEGVAPLNLSPGKATWRDAHSIFTIPSGNSMEKRPECFNLVARAKSMGTVRPDERFITHIVGLATAPNKAGKFLLWRHERMPVPVALLSENSFIEQLGGLLEAAERAALELNRRIRRIIKLYLSPDAESPGGRQPDKNEIGKVAESRDPRPAYWARLEKHFFELLENLHNDWDIEKK